MKTLSTDVLDIAHLDDGPADGPVVLLLHGWPDDPLGLAGVAEGLNARSFRTIRPWLRGFGQTRFRSQETLRDGRSIAIARDALDLLDALGIKRCSVIGHDWGGRAAYNLAALAPDRFDVIAVLAIGYAPHGRFVTTLDFEQARRWWYQWFMNAPGGAERVAADPIGFARKQWDDWSPAGWYDETAFERAAESFRNPDWAAITLHGYRSRWLPEAVDPRYDADAAIVAATGRLRTPTLMIQGAADGCDPPSESEGDSVWFDGPYRREVVTGVGHFPGREAPRSVVDAFCAFRDGLSQFGQK